MRSIIQLWIVQNNVQQNTLYLVMNFTMYQKYNVSKYDAIV